MVSCAAEQFCIEEMKDNNEIEFLYFRCYSLCHEPLRLRMWLNLFAATNYVSGNQHISFYWHFLCWFFEETKMCIYI